MCSSRSGKVRSGCYELWLEPESLSLVGFMYWHKKTRP